MPERPIPLSPTGAREATALPQHEPEQSPSSTNPSTSTDLGHTFTLGEAAVLVGVSIDTLKRRLSDGRFPNARQEPGRSGAQWRIPADELAEVAGDEGWTLDLATALPQHEPQHDDDLHQLLKDALESSDVRAQALATALAKQELAEERLGERTRERDQARADLDHADAELSRMASDHAETTANLAEMTGRAEILKTDLEVERAHVVKVRDEMQAAAVKLALTEQRVLDLAGEADDLTQQLVDARHRTERVEADAEAMLESMGWLARRRYRKGTPT